MGVDGWNEEGCLVRAWWVMFLLHDIHSSFSLLLFRTYYRCLCGMGALLCQFRL